VRQDWPDFLICHLFGVHDDTRRKFFNEVMDCFEEKVNPYLFYFPEKAEVILLVPEQFKKSFPNTLLVGDGFHIRVDLPEMFSLNSVTFSTYKWYNSLQGAICKLILCDRRANGL
jgi:hypothetical protein